MVTKLQKSLKRRYNICVVSPDGYAHTAAFDEAAEVLFWSFKSLGYDVSISKHLLLDRVNIIIGWHLVSNFSDIPKGSVILNTEQISSDFFKNAWDQRITMFKLLAKNYEIWDYCDANIVFYEQNDLPTPKVLRWGYHEKLSVIQEVAEPKKDIDVLFYGSITQRRKRILSSLGSAGLSIHRVFGIYGKARNELIGRAKLVLNLHAYGDDSVEPLRLFFLAANRIPVVSEESESLPAYMKNYAFYCGENNLHAAISCFLGSARARSALADSAYRSIKGCDQVAMLRQFGF